MCYCSKRSSCNLTSKIKGQEINSLVRELEGTFKTCSECWGWRATVTSPTLCIVIFYHSKPMRSPCLTMNITSLDTTRAGQGGELMQHQVLKTCAKEETTTMLHNTLVSLQADYHQLLWHLTSFSVIRFWHESNGIPKSVECLHLPTSPVSNIMSMKTNCSVTV